MIFEIELIYTDIYIYNLDSLFYEEVTQRLKCLFKSCHLKHITPCRSIKYIYRRLSTSMLQAIWC